jgi:GNAT superfamily N-acetyltransferase
VRITPLSDEHLGAWAGLFEASGSACFCRWWHFPGNKNEWLARCFEDPAQNRDEQAALVRAGVPEARGLLAMEDGAAIGWMKLAPRDLLPKLRRQGPYRALPVLDTLDVEGGERGEGGEGAGGERAVAAGANAIWSIGCVLVRPDRRRRGVATALVEAASEHVRAWGGRVIEAYPHRVTHALHDEEAWMGPERVFARLAAKGWRAVHDVAPYPVYRRRV